MNRGLLKSGRLAVLLLLVGLTVYYVAYGSSLTAVSSSVQYVKDKLAPGASADCAAPTAIPGEKSDKETPYERANATFVTLARNSDLYQLLDSIQSVEDRFNRHYHYDWVFFNDEDFDDKFQDTIRSVVSGTASFHRIPREYWGYPDWINQTTAAEGRKAMEEKGIIYAGSESYRHMCRFESGFFWRHPALNKYRYYWRVEPDIKFYCDIGYDVFKTMEQKSYKYAFAISIYEFRDTIATLWDTTKEFLKLHPEHVAQNNLMNFVSDDKGATYNLCHFWSNFEIADMDFWRGDAYSQYFDYLDRAGGFFYERWGDAPVHSIAASLFLDRSEIHHFEDIGYRHGPYMSCPSSREMRREGHCTCNPDDSFSWQGYSCTSHYYKSQGLKRPTVS